MKKTNRLNPLPLWRRLVISSFIFCQVPVCLAAEESLVFGILPAESPITMFKRFAPLRDYLSDKLRLNVGLETAKNLNEFARRTHDRRYDIVLTAPHMALLALDSGTYELAASFIKPLKAVVIVAQNSPVKTLQDLTGQTIATPPGKAIVTMVGEQFLNRQSTQGNMYNFRHFQTHNAAWNAALGGETEAAIIANFIYLKAKKQNAPIRMIAESDSFPGVGILVAKDLDPKLRESIKITLVSLKDEIAGRNILKKISHPGYGEVSPNQFEILRPFIFKLNDQP